MRTSMLSALFTAAAIVAGPQLAGATPPAGTIIKIASEPAISTPVHWYGRGYGGYGYRGYGGYGYRGYGGYGYRGYGGYGRYY